MDISNLSIFHFILFFLFNSWSAKGSTIDEWDYDHHHTKPEDWKGVCKFGREQSPININTHDTIKVKTRSSFTFHNYFEKTESSLRNNGHTLVMEFKKIHHHDRDGTKFNSKWIKGGSLPGSKFELRQAHFHWGSTSDQGSEHTINNEYSPMEMHLVHWNTDIAETYEEAIKSRVYNALAVLAINFRIEEKNNKLENFFKSVNNVRTQNQVTTLGDGVVLEDFLPDDTNKFFRYNGSLTTPGCNEIVVWTIFKERTAISQEQMDALRRTTYIHKGESDARVISNNYRPTQPLNGRNILDVKVKGLKVKGESSAKETLDRSNNQNSEEKSIFKEKLTSAGSRVHKPTENYIITIVLFIGSIHVLNFILIIISAK